MQPGKVGTMNVKAPVTALLEQDLNHKFFGSRHDPIPFRDFLRLYSNA